MSPARQSFVRVLLMVVAAVAAANGDLRLVDAAAASRDITSSCSRITSNGCDRLPMVTAPCSISRSFCSGRARATFRELSEI
jgi:hypothetical protein